MLTKRTKLDLSYAVRNAILSGTQADAIALAELIDMEWEREFGEWNRDSQDLHRGGESLEAPVMWGKHERLELSIFAGAVACPGIEVVVHDTLYMVDSRFSFPLPPWSESQIADFAQMAGFHLEYMGSH